MGPYSKCPVLRGQLFQGNNRGEEDQSVVSILLLLTVFFVALIGLPILWWSRRNSVTQLSFNGPRPRTTNPVTATEAQVPVGRKAYV
jgi:hypothetical protein